MHTYRSAFIEFILKNKVLCFGSFALKSGRVSPYFFNSGLFNTGETIKSLGEFYAQLIHEHYQLGKDYDLIFGPAYKGIPLVVATCTALFNRYQLDVPYAFNRKEKKQHGEGGNIVGASLDGKKILVIDDVITAGTAIGETADLLKKNNAIFKQVVIALDRQETGPHGVSAIHEVQEKYNVQVNSIINLDGIIEYLQQGTHAEMLDYLQAMEIYRQHYGAIQ